MKATVLRFFLVLTALTAIAACGSSGGTAGGDGGKIAIVDVDRIFQECNVGIQAAKILGDANNVLQGELKAMQAELGDKPDQMAQMKMQTAVNRYRQLMGMEEKRLFSAIQENFLRLVTDFRQKNNIQVVLRRDTALSYAPDAEITDLLIMELNKLDIALQPPALNPKGGNLSPSTGQTAPATGALSMPPATGAPATDAPATDAPATNASAAGAPAAQ